MNVYESNIENENTLNLKSASFVVMLRRYVFTHSQKKPRLHFGESFTLSIKFMAQLFHCHDQEENTNYHPLLREN